ncbi:uncharacterized protein LOC135503265 [Lineus longissimus]|uniref:uncharacterized protein LOC135503265 n=1 Tax=Lineus longissimus TaxID=88925 RepID=UPI00315D6A57
MSLFYIVPVQSKQTMNIQCVLATIFLVGVSLANEDVPEGVLEGVDNPDVPTCTIEQCIKSSPNITCPLVNDADIDKATDFFIECRVGDCMTHVEVDYVPDWTLYNTYDQWCQQCRCQEDGSVSCK